MTTVYIPKRAMFIFAHPDDIEFGCAGTAAVWAKNGCEVTYVIVTDGSIGSHDLEMTPEKLSQTREEEQARAADLAGVQRCLFLGYPDGQLEPTLKLRRHLVRLIRQYQPNVVVCGDPRVILAGNGTRINHPDHRAAATATIDAVYPSADSPLVFPELVTEGLLPHSVNYVLLVGAAEPNYFVDVSDTIGLKIEALRQHASQLGEWEPDDRIRKWARDIGARVGFAYAEAFWRITLKEDTDEESD